VIDIYMPDMKYADEGLARRYSKIRNYPAINRAAVKEMHRQVGDLVLDECGVAVHACWSAISFCPTASLARPKSCASSPTTCRRRRT